MSKSSKSSKMIGSKRSNPSLGVGVPRPSLKPKPQ